MCIHVPVASYYAFSRIAETLLVFVVKVLIYYETLFAICQLYFMVDEVIK